MRFIILALVLVSSSTECVLATDNNTPVSARIRRDRSPEMNAIEPTAHRDRTFVDQFKTPEPGDEDVEPTGIPTLPPPLQRRRYVQDHLPLGDPNISPISPMFSRRNPQLDNLNMSPILPPFEVDMDEDDVTGLPLDNFNPAGPDNSFDNSQYFNGYNAGVEAANRGRGQYLDVNHIFAAQGNDIPYKADLALKNVEVNSGIISSVGKALKKFENINADHLFERNINQFIALLILSNSELSDVSYEVILKAVIDILALDYKD